MEFNERKITTRHRLEAEIYAAILIKINGAVRKKERKNWKVQHTSGRCGNKNITLTSSSMFTFFSGIKREHASKRAKERANKRASKKERDTSSLSSVSLCVELRHPPLDFHNDHTQDLSFIFAQTEAERCVRGTRRKLRSCDEAQRRNNRA